MFKKSNPYVNIHVFKDYETVYPDWFFYETFEPYVERVLKIKFVVDEVEREEVLRKKDLEWLLKETPNET